MQIDRLFDLSGLAQAMARTGAGYQRGAGVTAD
jgi:hypothetical protein